MNNVFEYKTYGPEKEKITTSWGKLHKVGLHDLYSLPSTIQVITLSMRWVRNMAHTRGWRGALQGFGGAT